MKKKINIVFLVIILFCGIVGLTYAFFIETQDFKNKFSVGNFNVVIEEVFDDSQIFGSETNTINKDVYVVNKENTGAIVRITYDEYIIVATGSHYYDRLFSSNCSDSVDGFCFTKNWNSSFLNDWILHNGWYYYKKVLNPSESVHILKSVTNNVTNPMPNTSLYNLDFDIEAVQATEDAVKELWGKDVVVAADGTLTWNFS